MRFLNNLSIRRKQMLIIMLTSAITSLLSAVAFLGVEARNFRVELTEQISTMTQVVGDNCTAALDFNDPKAAEDTLGALRAEPAIANACVYNLRGEVFAVYNRSEKSKISQFPRAHPPGHEFQNHQLRIFQTVTMQNKKGGTIYVACDLYELDDRRKRFAIIAALVLGLSLVVALFLSVRLQRVISGPVLQLAHAVHKVTLEKNYAVRTIKQSNDELGQLMDGFNEMLVQIQTRDSALQTARDNLEKRVAERTQELENIHKQLMEASRRGGMAEIATNVLHNVGNVLNSVNISAGLVADKVKMSKTAGLTRVVGLLDQHAHDVGGFINNDPKGKHLPKYLADLTDCLVADQKFIASEVDSLRSNIEHIKEIVAMQQNYATVAGVKEMIDLTSLVEDSVRINNSALARHGVEIIRQFQKVPPMNVEKHKILQILVNLMRNAKYACDDSGREDKRITLRVANGNGHVRITIVDNGIGIPAENLTRIFNHGFTTRKSGHGFGLHSGALAAKAMGGSLTVLSEGTGQGASFTLELPCAPLEKSHV